MAKKQPVIQEIDLEAEGAALAVPTVEVSEPIAAKELKKTTKKIVEGVDLDIEQLKEEVRKKVMLEQFEAEERQRVEREMRAQARAVDYDLAELKQFVETTCAQRGAVVVFDDLGFNLTRKDNALWISFSQKRAIIEREMQRFFNATSPILIGGNSAQFA